MVRKGLFLWIVLLSKLLVAAQNTIYPTKAKGKPTKEVLLKLLQLTTKGLTKTFFSFHVYTHCGSNALKKLLVIIQMMKYFFPYKLVVNPRGESVLNSYCWLSDDNQKLIIVHFLWKWDDYHDNKRWLSLSCCTPLTKEGGITDKECLDS